MPQPMASPRQYPKLFSAICSTPWAMTEQQVHVLTEIMNLRAAGLQFTQEEISSRINQHQQTRLGQAGALLGEDSISGTKPQIIDGVAVLPVQGMLAPRMDMFMQYSGGTSTQELIAWIEDAATNQKVNSILLDIDSPGGDAHGNQEVADLLRQVREDMPVKAVISNLGASAAYYIGSAAGELIASPSAEVGSIGVYYVHREDTKANEADGYTYNVFRAGDDKNVANQHEVLTGHARQVTQQRMDALYRQFVQSVADGRKVSTEVVLADFGGGRVMLADQALAAGMVDRVATLQQVFQEMRRPGTTATGSRSTFNAVNVPPDGKTIMDPLIRNAAIQAGLATADASDEVVQAAVNGFFHARAESVPEDPTTATLALLQPGNRLTAAAEPAAPAEPPLDPACIAADAVSADAARRAEITATGNIMGMDPVDIAAACDDTTLSHDEATKRFRTISARNNQPVGTAGGVTIHGASEDRMAAAAVAGLAARFDCRTEADNAVQGAQDFANMSGLDLARLTCGTDLRQTVGMDSRDIALAALRGPDVNCQGEGSILAATGPMNPASLPNIMSAVLGRTLDRGLQQANTTFDFFAQRVDSVSDLNPKEIIRTGLFGEFDLLPDGEAPEDDKFDEEANWFKADRYGKRVSLTPEMIINEQMGSFLNNARNLAMGHDRTLNRLCVDQLISGIAGDGTALFHANHGNIVTGGGTVSTTQLDKMRQLGAKQKDVNNQATLGLMVRRLLVPIELDLDAAKVLRTDLSMVSTTEGGTDPYRGQFEYRVEPLLTDNDAAIWYGLMNPSEVSAIIYAYLRGYERMKRRFHFDANTETRHLDVQGAFAAAVNNWRGAVRNPGS